jgi:hypothetical protein
MYDQALFDYGDKVTENNREIGYNGEEVEIFYHT